jgi:hypothetical protein
VLFVYRGTLGATTLLQPHATVTDVVAALTQRDPLEDREEHDGRSPITSKTVAGRGIEHCD